MRAILPALTFLTAAAALLSAAIAGVAWLFSAPFWPVFFVQFGWCVLLLWVGIPALAVFESLRSKKP